MNHSLTYTPSISNPYFIKPIQLAILNPPTFLFKPPRNKREAPKLSQSKAPRGTTRNFSQTPGAYRGAQKFPDARDRLIRARASASSASIIRALPQLARARMQLASSDKATIDRAARRAAYPEKMALCVQPGASYSRDSQCNNPACARGLLSHSLLARRRRPSVEWKIGT